jgi:thiamine biosynthesis lipoprotein
MRAAVSGIHAHAMNSRRDFLASSIARPATEAADQGLAEPGAILPAETVRLSQVAMRADFEVLLPCGAASRLEPAWKALELLDPLEEQMSVYRPQSELSRLNARAANEKVAVAPRLYGLLRRALCLAAETQGAFDPTAGRLVALWRACRLEHRLPAPSEVQEALRCQGYTEIQCDDAARGIQFSRPGIALNLNAIGKGFALDQLAEFLDGWGREKPEPIDAAGENPTRPAAPVNDYLLHGGYSSIVARGSLPGCAGWPVGLAHPLFPGRQVATITLNNQALSTSGSAVQYFRYRGKRYGHIVDPRTGQPAEEVLSATVVARDAALAEALSTAFFVLGVEKSLDYCHNHEGVAMFLVPVPHNGKRAPPVAFGFEEGALRVEPQTDECGGGG